MSLRSLLWQSPPVKVVRYLANVMVKSPYRKWNQGASRAKMDRLGLVKLLNLRPGDAWGADFPDNLYLYRLVREKKPKTVLEFGSGCSTVVISQALYENARDNSAQSGKIYSVESEKQWADTTANNLPEHLRPFCEVIHGPMEQAKHAGNDILNYTNVPAVDVDILYLDGPWFQGDIQIAGNPLYLEDRFKPGFLMIVDGREPNTFYLRDHLKRKYHFKKRWLYNNSVFTLVS